MAQNLLINGSVFNGVESIDMVNANGEQVTYVEKVNAGTGVPVAKIGEREFYTVEDALAGAVAGDTVTMIANSTENVNLIIPNGVTLDIKSFTLTAISVLGLHGSKLTGAADGNKNYTMDAGGVLKVARENLILPADNDTKYFPIWDITTDGGVYRFTQIVMNTNVSSGRGLRVNEEEDWLEFQFKNQATSDPYNVLMKNYGGSELGFGVVVRVEWESLVGGETVTTYRDFVFSDATMKAAAGSTDYYVKMPNLTSQGVDKATMRVYAMFVTDSGATAYSEKWNKDGIIS